ncbi:SNase-like nuclease [Bradyrhizobiaceae bacterium SG-6C]|nr:SNase-like nuclease [Bradyrhizobiaceae bacterium SG-6C]
MFVRSVLLLLMLASTAWAEPVSVNDIRVKDGDTIYYKDVEYRMVGYDTPEIQTRRRKVGPDERAVASIATERFAELLKSGPLDLTEVECACSAKARREGTCNYGRKCGLLTLNGKNIGDTLIAEELAVPFRCSLSRCEKMPDWPKIIEGWNTK